ncbi:MAG: TIGR01777 family oxidoreductase [Planctomycetota bacterium]
MSSPPTVAITGASGLVGKALAEDFASSGWQVKRLVRGGVRHAESEIAWDPAGGTIDQAALEGLDAVVHLAGENIAEGRWTKEKKRRIVESRTGGTRLLAEALARCEAKPRVLVSASAIGFYGNRGDEELTEESPAGQGFLAETCVAWESANEPAWQAGIRVVQVRVGLVLDLSGGLLGKVLPIFKMGGGGVLGSGAQYMSWIDLADLVRIFRRAVDDDSLNGAINGVAPNPVTNREFTKTLGRVLSRPTVAPAPAFGLRLAFGEMADEMLLAGARVLPTRLQAAGFEFQSTDLEPTLRRLLDR